MSSAAADYDDDDDAPQSGKKKLIIILAIVAILVVGGLLALRALQSNQSDYSEDDEYAEVQAPARPAAKRRDPKAVPTFVPLEVFVVNLADKDAERYAQVGVTLEVDDPQFAEQIKAYMPAIRNGILMLLAHKTSEELLQREGKVRLSREIMREAVLPLGIDVAPPQRPRGDDDYGQARVRQVYNPVTHVHFSSFIIQ